MKVLKKIKELLITNLDDYSNPWDEEDVHERKTTVSWVAREVQDEEFTWESNVEGKA